MNEGGAILIVEDDADVQRAARLALVPHVGRIESLPAPDALEEALRRCAFEAVLLDMNFVAGARSGSGGLNALARIRAIDPNLSVVLMTAYGGVSLAVEALKQGAADFILKPWHNEKLVAAIAAAMQATRLRRAGETLELDALERSTIEKALSQYRGNVSQAAAALGLTRPALYRRMSKHGIASPASRPEDNA